MAKSKVKCTSVFLLVLIFSAGIISSAGRKLKAEKINPNNCDRHGKNGADFHPSDSCEKQSGYGGSGCCGEGGADVRVTRIEDGVPTGPGHSPGVGHSVGPNSRKNP
ncbi:hypothetical protein RHSIM_Rhsim07G0231100 [Rhododendron simsii]|uniref:Uncharacterized protein n=1 Tax=Rhododendron simsii TaxID=118357 RepID=A0A834LH12_RHOSS|nr:hypothetical protein RHSIM_Rhsim07G0231100 [Rhododendron simsii]